MNQENLLIGKWYFIGAERFVVDKWQPTGIFVKGMCWEFKPIYFVSGKYLGTIIETVSDTQNDKMSYSFDDESKRLETEIFTSAEPDDYFNPQTDKYQVSVMSENTIKISILNQVGCPPPYFRYELQRE